MVKPLHFSSSFAVLWFSGAFKSSRRYFLTKTTCLNEGREITARSLHWTNPTDVFPTVKFRKFA